MFGPAFVPKFPVRREDESVEGSEELVASCRLPLSFTVNRNSPSSTPSSSAVGGVEPDVLTTVITKVTGSVHEPV